MRSGLGSHDPLFRLAQLGVTAGLLLLAPSAALAGTDVATTRAEVSDLALAGSEIVYTTPSPAGAPTCSPPLPDARLGSHGGRADVASVAVDGGLQAVTGADCRFDQIAVCAAARRKPGAAARAREPHAGMTAATRIEVPSRGEHRGACASGRASAAPATRMSAPPRQRDSLHAYAPPS
jgi:hypothetical protein